MGQVCSTIAVSLDYKKPATHGWRPKTRRTVPRAKFDPGIRLITITHIQSLARG